MSKPLVLVVEHDAECPPALFGAWLVEAGCVLETCRPYAGDDLPELSSYDGLLVLGGPMGAADDHAAPWLPTVRDRVRESIALELPTLGICLGHQLVALALGGTVERNPRGQQVGLLDVAWTDAASDDALMGELATPRRGVQWNDDLVTALPAGAVSLAATPAGELQAACFASNAWGVQLHPEVDTAVLAPWAASDQGSHEARGIDQVAVLREIDDARDELDRAWRPLAQAFAARVAGFAGRRR